MENVVLTVHLILALLLIGVVLLQRSEGGGLMSGGGGGAMSARGAANAMTKLTWILAVAFISTSIILTVLSAQKSQSGSVLDGVSATEADTPVTAPAVPEGDLLPPTSGDSPVAPPAAD